MKFKAMQTIFSEGDSGDKMFVIQTGRVAILKKVGSTMNMVAELGPGSILGEMSLLDNQPRSATAKALDETTLAVVDQGTFESTLSTLPQWMTAVVRIMVSRLRKATSQKHFNHLQNALPAMFLLLQQSPASEVQFNQLAQQLHILYGLSAADTQQLLQMLQHLNILTLKSNQNIAVKNSDEIGFIYKYLMANNNRKESLLKSPELHNLPSKNKVLQIIQALDSGFMEFIESLAKA